MRTKINWHFDINSASNNKICIVRCLGNDGSEYHIVGHFEFHPLDGDKRAFFDEDGSSFVEESEILAFSYIID